MTHRIKITDHMDLFRVAHDAIPIPPSETVNLPAHEYVKSSWREWYGVDIDYKDNRAQYLDFRDEKHYNLVCIKCKLNGSKT